MAEKKNTNRRGRGTTRSTTTSAAAGAARWTERQVATLLKAVEASATAKAGFEVAASELGKSVGTVQQKYYALQRKARNDGEVVAPRRRGRPAGSARRATVTPTTVPARVAPSRNGSADELRTLTIDELTSLAHRVKAEVERRRSELDAAARLFG